MKRITRNIFAALIAVLLLAVGILFDDGSWYPLKQLLIQALFIAGGLGCLFLLSDKGYWRGLGKVAILGGAMLALFMVKMLLISSLLRRMDIGIDMHAPREAPTIISMFGMPDFISPVILVALFLAGPLIVAFAVERKKSLPNQ